MIPKPKQASAYLLQCKDAKIPHSSCLIFLLPSKPKKPTSYRAIRFPWEREGGKLYSVVFDCTKCSPSFSVSSELKLNSDYCVQDDYFNTDTRGNDYRK